MIREEVRSSTRRPESYARAEPIETDILGRIAALVGEIDALKRERHAEPVFGARARLASTYFIKRGARSEAEPA
jgi:hypothetical protein